MKKMQIFFIIGLCSIIGLSAQPDNGLENDNAKQIYNTPAVSVDKLYVDENRLTDKEGTILTKRQLFDLLIDQYSKSKVLEVQLQTLDIQPKVSVPDFPANISRKRSSELVELTQQYNKTGKILEEQIASSEKMTLTKLQLLLDSTQNSISHNMYDHEVEKLKLYEEQRRKFEDFYEKLKQEKLNELFKYSVPVFNASLVGRQFFLPGSGVTSDFSLGGKFELSLYPIFNGADFIEISGEFMKPRFYTEDAFGNEYAWNINWYNAGLNLKIPGRIDLGSFSMGMRIGAGYYWGEARQYNSGYDQSDWRGYNLNFEVDLMKYAWFYPLDLFVQYSIYYPTQDFVFNTGDGSINLGKGMFSGLAVGIRLCLWWEDKYK